MKRALFVVLLVCAVMMAPQALLSAQNAQSAFDQVKSLAGEWQGQSSMGGQTFPVKLKFEVISGGSAVMETMQPGNEPAMVSVYHENGDKIMMTHYCTGNNQPRLQTASLATPGKLDFEFLDISNLTSPDTEHISGMVLTIKDNDHITEEWKHSGKETMGNMVVEFTRVK
jgi:outer membrane lipoprotein-sorting protein